MTETTTKLGKEDGRRPAGAERAGRLVGVALFWLMAVYIVGASTISVVTQLFGEARPVGTAAEGACADQLDKLTRELQRLASSTLTDPAPSALSALGTWDQQLTALEGRCGRLEGTRELLSEVRGRMGHMLREFQDTEGPQLARITRRLQPFIAPE